jgi:hypothetical protein
MRACGYGGEDAVGKREVGEGVVACADEAEEEAGLGDRVFGLGRRSVCFRQEHAEEGRSYVGRCRVDAPKLRGVCARVGLV